METDLRARRTALGWSRKELGVAARCDTAVIQLLELGQSSDTESLARCMDAIEAEETRRRNNGSGSPIAEA